MPHHHFILVYTVFIFMDNEISLGLILIPLLHPNLYKGTGCVHRYTANT